MPEMGHGNLSLHSLIWLLRKNIFRLAKETHSRSRSGDFKSKLLNMMMMLNVGNLAKLSKEELIELVEQARS